MAWYVRARGLVATTTGETCIFVLPGAAPIVLEPVDVQVMSRLLAGAALPIAEAALLEHGSKDAIARLVKLGVLVRGANEQALKPATPARSEQKRCNHVVLGLSGAVSVAGALDDAVALADHFARSVDVVFSEGARRFVRPELYDFYGFRTWTEPFESSHGIAVPHEHLAMTTDLVIVAPASAGTLHRLASGACSDLISLIVAATTAPVVVVPSMNPQMWLHPPIQRNVEQLRADGIWVVEPRVGFLVAMREQRGVGAAGVFDSTSLVHTLDAVLAARST